MTLALIAAAQTAPLPMPTTEDEIVVVAEKMRYIEVNMKLPKRGGFVVLERCRVSKPSGYAELDAIPCSVAQDCMADAPTTRKALTNCVETRSQGRLDAVVAAWRAARKVSQ